MKHIKSWFKVAWLVIFLWSTAPCVFAVTYRVTDLGVLADLAGQPKPVATISAVNMSGKATGVTASGNRYLSFIYGGSRTNLGTLGGWNCYAQGINDSNVVCGVSSYTTNNGNGHGFRWTPGSTNGVPSNRQMTDLGTLGGNLSEAHGINLTGQIAGASTIDMTDSIDHACRFNPNSTITDIGALMPPVLAQPSSYGYGINQAGQVAGTAYDLTNYHGVAFFYDGTNVTLLGDLSDTNGANGSEAYAINSNGIIAGYARDKKDLRHAFRWTRGQTNGVAGNPQLTDLGTLGGDYSYGLAINNSNTIVGGSFTDSKDTIYHAFICISNTMTDLNTQLDASGAGWELGSAKSISDAGQIVGLGTNNGVQHGFLLTPLTPAPPFQITSISVNGTNVTIGFPTVTGATYHLEERTNLITGSGWSNVLSGIAGNGSTLFLTHTNGKNLRARFYRMGFTVP